MPPKVVEMAAQSEACSRRLSPIVSNVVFSSSPSSVVRVAEASSLHLPSISNELETTAVCEICHLAAHGQHFGVQSCRACAAFFRRSIVEQKLYRCRQSGSCPVKKSLRNTCRFCRFQRCSRLGMNKADVQLARRDPIGRRADDSESEAARRSSSVSSTSPPAVASSSNGGVETQVTIEPSTSNDMAMLMDVTSTTIVRPIATPAIGSSLATPIASSLSATHSLASSAIFGPTAVGLGGLVPSSTVAPISRPSTSTPPPPLTLSPAVVHWLISSTAEQQAAAATMPTIEPSTTSNLNDENHALAQLLLADARQRAAAVATLPIPPNATTLVSPSSIVEPPTLLQRLLSGYTNYVSRQKSLYAVMWPNNWFSPTYRLVSHADVVRAERGSISLALSMINEWLQPIVSLTHELKVSMLQPFVAAFTRLEQCYRTSLAFTSNDDTRLVLSHGMIVDATALDTFFGDHFAGDDKEATIAASCCSTIFCRCRALASRMRALEMREIEVAAIAGLLLCAEATSVGCMEMLREQIYAQLHADIVANFGLHSTGSRLGQILSLSHDCQMVAREINDEPVVAKLLNPHFVVDALEEHA